MRKQVRADMTVGKFNREFGVILRRPDGRRYRADKRIGQVRTEEAALKYGHNGNGRK